MFLKEKTQADFGIDPFQCTTRNTVWVQCDYCGIHFTKEKKTVIKLRKNIEKDSCGGKSCTAAKKKDVCVAKHGCENVFQSKTVQQKIKNTNLEKHGCETYLSSVEFKDKRKKALLANLGVDSPLKSEAVKERMKATCVEKFGCDNYAKTDEFHGQYKATAVKNFGTPAPMSIPEVQAKKQATTQQRYGVDNYAQTAEFKKKKSETCMTRYGFEHPSGSPKVRAKFTKTMRARYGVNNYAETQECKDKMRKHFVATIGVPNPLCLQQNRKYGKAQNEMAEWLKSIGFEFTTDYKILDGKEIDLYNESKKIAIEYCGLFWHTELSPQPRGSKYHRYKYDQCKSQGIRLLTIFEDEWKTRRTQCCNFIKSILGKHTLTAYARKCLVKEVPKKEFDAFCDTNHIQGANHRSMVRFGLFYNDELIGAISLARHHRKSKELVLDRLCFKDDWKVVGGAGKLFEQCKSWAKTNGHNKITSWSDNRWSEGGVYEKLGFVMEEELKPDYGYVYLAKPYSRISKQSQKKSLSGCPKEKTELEWSTEHGLARIWDCGKKRWVFNV